VCVLYLGKMDIGNVQNVGRVRNLRNIHFIRQQTIYKIRKNPYNELTNFPQKKSIFESIMLTYRTQNS